MQLIKSSGTVFTKNMKYIYEKKKVENGTRERKCYQK